MTIKRLDPAGTIEVVGLVADGRGTQCGRARLTLSDHHRIIDAGTHQDPDAELRGIRRTRAYIEFQSVDASQMGILFEGKLPCDSTMA